MLSVIEVQEHFQKGFLKGMMHYREYGKMKHSPLLLSDIHSLLEQELIGLEIHVSEYLLGECSKGDQ